MIRRGVKSPRMGGGDFLKLFFTWCVSENRQLSCDLLHMEVGRSEVAQRICSYYKSFNP